MKTLHVALLALSFLLGLVLFSFWTQRRGTPPSSPPSLAAIGSGGRSEPAETTPSHSAQAGLRPAPERPSTDWGTSLQAAVASVKGRVVDALGGPLVGALVTLRSNAGGVVAVSTTASDGSFAISQMSHVGQLCAEAEAYSRTCAQLGAATEGHLLVLTPASRIVGRVRRRSDGADLVGATVIASNCNGLFIPERTATTGADGMFAFEGLPAGGYKLVAVATSSRSVEEWVAIGIGETSERVTLWSEQAVRVGVQVFVAGVPCASGSVRLSGPIIASSPTDAEGSGALDGIVSGHYEATAVCEGAQFQTVALEVGDEPVQSIFRLEAGEKPADREPTGTIQATLDTEFTPSLAAFAESVDGTVHRARQSAKALIFEGLPVGRYRVYVNDNIELAQSTQIEREGEVVYVRLKGAAFAWIAGQVTSSDGVPLADAWVSAQRSDLLPAPPAGAPVLTEADGSFQLPAVSDVSYTLTVASPSGDTTLYGVRAGSDVVAVVQAAASLSGRVRTAQGASVPEFRLTYRMEDRSTGAGLLGRDSAFRLPALEPGVYSLQLTSAVGSAHESVRLEPGQDATVTLTLSADHL